MTPGGPDTVRSTRLFALTVAVIVLVFGACGADHSAPDAKLVAIGAGLRGPAGLAATVYARGVPRVSALTFDAQSRLWLATADSRDRGKDAVYLVGKSGAVPKPVLRAAHTPLGLLWYRGALYVASAGRVDAYRRFDGRTFASHRVILELPAGTGENNQIVLGRDGRLLMGISAPCDHCRPASKLSGSVVSFRPDGTDLRVYASRIRAPVGLAFRPGTKDLYVTMNERDDLGSRTRGDTLAIVGRGQTFGFPDCYGQGGAACSHVPKPVAVLDKHAAVGGVALVAGELRTTGRPSALVAEWATGNVQQVALSGNGSGTTGSVAPFLTGLKNPVPVVGTPDGALLVGDWSRGIVYRIARTG